MIILPKVQLQVRKLEADKAKEGNCYVFCRGGRLLGFRIWHVLRLQKRGRSLIESNGVSFLMDASKHSEYLDGSVIHFDDGLNGKGFDIQNPNASSTCGCGRSFN